MNFFDDYVREELELIKLELIRSHLRLNQKASGKWIDGLEVQVKGTSGAIWGENYTEWIAKGRPPNKDKGMAAVRAWAGWAANTFIRDWLDAKGLDLPAYGVAMNIALHGTKSHPKGTDLLDAVLTEMRLFKAVKNIQAKVEHDLIGEMRNQYARL